MPALIGLLGQAIPWIGGGILAWMTGLFGGTPEEEKDSLEKTVGISTKQVLIIAAVVLVIYLIFRKDGK